MDVNCPASASHLGEGRRHMLRRHTIASALTIAFALSYAPQAAAQAEAATTWAYCFSTDTRQCSLAGRHYLEGTGGAEVTPSWAQLAWQHGCEHDDGESCRELGMLHDQGRVVAQSNERAYQLFGRGCQAGSMNSCHEQARMLRLGRGVRTNVSEANRLDTWACDHGSSAACVQMASVFSQGQGVARNPEESSRLLQRACQLGDAGACLGSIAGSAADAANARPPAAQDQGGAPAPGRGGQQGQPTQQVTVPTAPAGYAAGQGAAAQPRDPVMDPRVVQAAMNEVMPRLTQCYERRARRVPMSGTIMLQWRVDAQGRAIDVAVNAQVSTIQDAWMHRCIRNSASRMRFNPAPWRTSEPVMRSLSFNQ